MPFLFSTRGGTLDVGMDTGSPVGHEPNEFRFTGTIERIDVTVRPDPLPGAADVAAGQLRGALGTQ